MRTWIAAFALVAVATGCAFVRPSPPAVVLPGGEGRHELPLSLQDPEGIVESVEAGEPSDNSGDPAITQLDPDTALLTWLGGACDARARMWVRGHEGSIGAGVATEQNVGAGCPALGVPRAVAITFREPIGDRTLVIEP